MTLLSSLQKLTKFLTILQELRTVRSAELWKYQNVRQCMVMVVSLVMVLLVMECRYDNKKVFYTKYLELWCRRKERYFVTSGGAVPAQGGRKEERQEEKSGWRWNHPGCHITSPLLQCRAIPDQ